MRVVVAGAEPDSAESVLAHAVLEAESTARTLEAVHSYSSVWYPGIGDVVGASYAVSQADAAVVALRAQDLCEALLDKVVLHRDPPLPARARALEGEAGPVLVQASQDAALVVVGGRGHGTLVGALLGSPTGYVLHRAACPVMVVPATAVLPYSRVVVAYDDSPSSRSALRWGADAARRHGVPLVVAHAWTVPAVPAAMAGDLVLHDVELARRRWLQEAVEAVLPDAAPQLVVQLGSTARALLELTHADDLLVLGTRGHGGFVGLVLGSVATQCAEHATGAVVVVRTGEERLAPS